MNQIIENKNVNLNRYTKQSIFFKILFIIFISIIVFLIIYMYFYFNYLNKKEQQSNFLMNNYSFYDLYDLNIKKENLSNNLFGIIEIPKINIYYPIFSHLDKELLKISPCKFYGEELYKNGNICIAGHNYDNSLFFSKIPDLVINDIIFIYDINNNKYIYHVSNIYEVKESNLSPIFNYKKNEKTLTLVTCNNLNSNRIIVRAKQN